MREQREWGLLQRSHSSYRSPPRMPQPLHEDQGSGTLCGSHRPPGKGATWEKRLHAAVAPLWLRISGRRARGTARLLVSQTTHELRRGEVPKSHLLRQRAKPHVLQEGRSSVLPWDSYSGAGSATGRCCCAQKSHVRHCKPLLKQTTAPLVCLNSSQIHSSHMRELREIRGKSDLPSHIFQQSRLFILQGRNL